MAEVFLLVFMFCAVPLHLVGLVVSYLYWLDETVRDGSWVRFLEKLALVGFFAAPFPLRGAPPPGPF